MPNHGATHWHCLPAVLDNRPSDACDGEQGARRMAKDRFPRLRRFGQSLPSEGRAENKHQDTM